MQSFFTLCLLCFFLTAAKAQPAYTTQAGTGNNTYSFNSAIANKLQNIYTPSNWATLPPSGYVSSIFFKVGTTFASTSQVRTSTDVRVGMGYVGIPDFSSTSTFFTTLDTVYYAPTRTYTALVLGDWVEFPLQVPFFFDNTLNLLVQQGTANTASNQGFNVYNASIASKRLYALHPATTGSVGSGLSQIGFNMIPLAVALSDFGARKEGDNALLYWRTSSETHTSFFEIERSYDGNSFIGAGKVQAKNTAGTYSFLDAGVSLTGAKVFYRLRIVDHDGSVSMSRIVQLGLPFAGVLKVHPNPAENRVLVSLPLTPQSPVSLTISDAMGKAVWSGQFEAGNPTLTLTQLGLLPAGTYYILVYADGEVYTDKLVKK